MSIKRIVAGTDFSPEAEVAVQQAMTIAKHTRAQLTLVHAFASRETEQIWLQHALARPEIIRELLQNAVATAHERLEQQRRQLAGQGVETAARVVDAPEPDGICEAASRAEADLVVIGPGRHRAIIGGTAERVVRGCDSDVLVARSDGGAGGFRRILVPVDFSPRSLRALQVARELAAADATIEILHAHQLPAAIALYDALEITAPEFAETLAAEDRKRCAQLAASDEDPRFHVVGRTIAGPPRLAVVGHANAGLYDLIVIGSHGRRPFARFFLGSVAESVLRGVSCSVLVTHGSEPKSA